MTMWTTGWVDIALGEAIIHATEMVTSSNSLNLRLDVFHTLHCVVSAC
jgi:hypothetical protein